jgi:hypothetical protein
MTATPKFDRPHMSRGTLPRVDVLVPCYGYGHLLADTVSSLCRQRHIELRVVILDDASPDHTADVAAGLAARDSRVEVVRHDVNRGHIATYNHALSLVQGDFVALVSADDVLTQDALARAAHVMTRYPEVGFVYGRVRQFRQRWVEPRSLPLGTAIWSGDQWLRQRCQRGVNVIASPEVVVRTSTHRQVGGYEPSLPHTADLHLWLRLASVADVAYLRGRHQAGYRIHERSLQRTVHAGPLIDLEERHGMFRHLVEHVWADRPDVEELARSAMQALYGEALQRARRAHERHDDELAPAFDVLARRIAHSVQPALTASPYPEPGGLPQAICSGVRRRVTRSATRLRREVLGT